MMVSRVLRSGRGDEAAGAAQAVQGGCYRWGEALAPPFQVRESAGQQVPAQSSDSCKPCLHRVQVQQDDNPPFASSA